MDLSKPSETFIYGFECSALRLVKFYFTNRHLVFLVMDLVKLQD